MAASENRAALNGLEKMIFKLVSKGATAAQWREWLRAPLEHALAVGHKGLVSSLLEAGADGGAGWRGCDGRTLLCAAAEGGNPEAVSTLLEAGGSRELDAASGPQRRTALHRAIAGGHTDAARVLMLAGANVRLVDRRHRSALHYAIEGGHLQLAENVIIGGAHLSEDVDGETPLHLAAAHDDGAFVGTLLRRGASVDVPNDEGNCPLHVAIKHGHVAVAEALLRAGADPEESDEDDFRPLYIARSSLAMTKLLLKHGADVNAADDHGYTVLHRLAGNDAVPGVVEALVEAGGDLQAKSGPVSFTAWGEFNGLSPLHCTAMNCDMKIMDALLRHGADVNAGDGDGLTPLHAVCEISAHDDSENDHLWTLDAADALLRWGADETLTDNDGRTPFDIVGRGMETRPLRRLLKNAPAERAWRRRGMLVMCRALPDKLPGRGRKGKASKTKRGRGRGRGGGGANRGREMADILVRVVELDDDDIFRTIVGFL